MKRTLIACAIPALVSGCYMVPVSPDQVDRLTTLLDQAQRAQIANAVPKPVPAPTAAPIAMPTKDVPPIAIPGGPVTLYARLYPSNDIATENGMVSGTVTSLMNGKGRFQVVYRGEPLTGEATRVSGEDRKGVASAWGPNGTFMSCEYQMASYVRGAGTCNFSDGAKYQVHVGN
ncbi:MAG: hypothetical protein JOZ85_01410 [Betaproteobacteria bacterium]|nr:hypothetical protein [Betaproteobacteria bacterium]